MHLHKPLGASVRHRPFASSRHRLKHGLMAAVLRDDPSTFDRPLSDDVLSDMPATARQVIREQIDGGLD